MKNTYITLFALIIYNFTSAQSLKIIDANTKEILPYGSVYIKGKPIGTIGDVNGIIDLSKIDFHDSNSSHDTICITYTGYFNYCMSLHELKNTNDITIIPLQLFNQSLPPIVYTPPNIDSILVHAFINTYKLLIGNAHWKKFKGRTTIFSDTNKKTTPVLLKENIGELFCNQISTPLIIKIRYAHNILNEWHTRTTTNLSKELQHFYAAMMHNDFITYDDSYYLPYSPQLFNKKIEKIYDEHGINTIYKVTLTPKSYNFLSTIKLADFVLSNNHYRLLKMPRSFYIDLSDTTISEIHIADQSTYGLKFFELSQVKSINSYFFTRTSNNDRYLSFASKTTYYQGKKIKENYTAIQNYWFEEPEVENRANLSAINKRADNLFKDETFKSGEHYLRANSSDANIIENDPVFWKNIKMPDYPFCLGLYKQFKDFNNFTLFMSK